MNYSCHSVTANQAPLLASGSHTPHVCSDTVPAAARLVAPPGSLAPLPLPPPSCFPRSAQEGTGTCANTSPIAHALPLFGTRTNKRSAPSTPGATRPRAPAPATTSPWRWWTASVWSSALPAPPAAPSRSCASARRATAASHVRRGPGALHAIWGGGETTNNDFFCALDNQV